MQASQRPDGSYELHVSEVELRIIRSALNETLEAVPESEISSRMGATPEEVKALHLSLRQRQGREGPP